MEETRRIRREIEAIKEEIKQGPPPCTCPPEDLRDNGGYCACGHAYWNSDREFEIAGLEKEYGFALEDEIDTLERLGF